MKKYLIAWQNITVITSSKDYNGYVQYVNNTTLKISYFDLFWHEQTTVTFENLKVSKFNSDENEIICDKINKMGVVVGSIKIEL